MHVIEFSEDGRAETLHTDKLPLSELCLAWEVDHFNSLILNR
jgi:hypothetical protein